DHRLAILNQHLASPQCVENIRLLLFIIHVIADHQIARPADAEEGPTFWDGRSDWFARLVYDAARLAGIPIEEISIRAEKYVNIRVDVTDHIGNSLPCI